MSRTFRHRKFRKTLNRAYASVLLTAAIDERAFAVVTDDAFGNVLPYNLEVENQAFDLFATQPDLVRRCLEPQVQVLHWQRLLPVAMHRVRRLSLREEAALAFASTLVALYVGAVGAHKLRRAQELQSSFRELWGTLGSAGLLDTNGYVHSEFALLGSYVGCSEHILEQYVQAPEVTRRHLVGDSLFLLDSRLSGPRRRPYFARMVQGKLDYRELAKASTWGALGRRLLWSLQTKGLNGSAGLALMYALWRDELRQRRASDSALGRDVDQLEAQLERRKAYSVALEEALAGLPVDLRSDILALWHGA